MEYFRILSLMNSRNTDLILFLVTQFTPVSFWQRWIVTEMESGVFSGAWSCHECRDSRYIQVHCLEKKFETERYFRTQWTHYRCCGRKICIRVNKISYFSLTCYGSHFIVWNKAEISTFEKCSLHTYVHTYIHTYIHTIHSFIHSFIHKFVTAAVRCGIGHKVTKHTDKCSNNKIITTQKQNDKTTDK